MKRFFLSFLLLVAALTSSVQAQAVYPQPDNKSASGSVTSATTLVAVETTGYESVYWSYSSVGAGNTVTTEVSIDGATWIAFPTARAETVVSLSTTHTPGTGNVYGASVPLKWFRLRVSAYSSGTVTAALTLRKSPAPNFAQARLQVAIGSSANNNLADVSAPTDNAAAPTALSVNAYNRLWDGTDTDRQSSVVNGTNSTGTGIAAAGIVGQCDDASQVTTTENQFGNARIHCNDHAVLQGSQCNSRAQATITAGNTTQVIALSGSTVIRVCSYTVGIATTGTWSIVEGTGSNCGTGTATIVPATTLTAGNVVAPTSPAPIFRGTAANALCVAAVTGNVQFSVSYAQY